MTAVFQAFFLIGLSVYEGEVVWCICFHNGVRASAFEELAGYALPVAVWWPLRRVWRRRFNVEGRV
ncbi:MAG: hypothetical protein JWO82_2262 [Akkermansiaceae bacterium]|nr:hypothetical protein [Akkermansiaceae bacterium]